MIRKHDLLHQALDGSEVALGRLLDLMRPRMLDAARQQLGSTIRLKASESDVVQSAVLLAVRDFAQFRGTQHSQLEGWLMRILRHHVLNVAVKHRHAKRRAVSREQPIERAKSRLSSNDPTPSQVLASQEEVEHLRDALRRLPPDEQQVVRWRYEQNLSFAEIARRLKWSPDRSRRTWYAAVHRLKSELAQRI